MMSQSASLSRNSSPYSPLKVQRAGQTRRSATGAVYEVSPSIRTRSPVVNSALVPPCVCEEPHVSRSNMKSPPASVVYFYGAANQNRVDGSGSKMVCPAQPLRHPPENWTAEISQEICIHHDEVRSRQTSHTEYEGKFQRAQVPDKAAEQQVISSAGHRVLFESVEKKVKGILVAQNTHATREAVVHAALANAIFSRQVNPLTSLSYSHGARPEGCTDRTRDFAALKPYKNNLLRSVSADATNEVSSALVPSTSHSQQGQLGITGSQKQGKSDFRAAANSIFESPPTAENASELAEKSRVAHRIVSFAKGPKRKGERDKKEQEAKLKREGELKCAVAGTVLSTKCTAKGEPIQDNQRLSDQQGPSHCYHARWRLQRGKSPSLSSPNKLKQTSPCLASHTPGFPRAPELPRRTDCCSSETLLLRRELEPRPHILVRSYKTFQQECAKHHRPHKVADVAHAEDIPEGDGRTAFQKRACMGGPGACLSRTVECSSSECEASRGIQKQFFFSSKHPRVHPPTPHPSAKEDDRSGEREAPGEGQSLSTQEHLARNSGRATARYLTERSPGETPESVESFEGPCQALPRRLLLKRLLGSGAMGRVYLVELDQRPYAVKIALQSDPAACMYLRQGWRNLVHLEKIHQQRQRHAANQATAPSGNDSCQAITEHGDVSRCASAGSVDKQAAYAGCQVQQDPREIAAVESASVAEQRGATERRKSKQLIERDLPVRGHGDFRENSEAAQGKVERETNVATTPTDNMVGLQHDVEELLPLHTNRRHIREESPGECRQVVLPEEMSEKLKSWKQRKDIAPFPMSEKLKSWKQRKDVAPFPATFHSVSPAQSQQGRFCRKSGVGSCGKVPVGGEGAGYEQIKVDKRERYFCRPIAFLEGDWFPIETLQQEPQATMATAAKVKNLHLPGGQRTFVGQKLPTCELVAVQQVTNSVGPAACFASHSSRNSRPLRKHKNGWKAPVEQDVPASTCVVTPIPVCAYIMEYIPDACQLTAVIWNLHRCLDPSHALRRDCHNSLVAQRLIEIGIRVAEAHKCIASEAGLYSFDFNPKNILVSVVSKGRRDVSPRPPAVATMKMAARCTVSPLAAGGSMRTRVKACTEQKGDVTASRNPAFLRSASPAAQQQQHLHPNTRQQQQQQKRLHALQQHTRQQQTQQQLHVMQQQQQQHTQPNHLQTNLSPADITRLVLCEPQVSFRVVAIDLDCSLQTPFSSCAAAVPAGAGPAAVTPSSTPSTQEDEVAPLLDWSCGRRVVYSCPHISSITAAYIIAVLAKNKGEGQFTRSGLTEAAAHAALCCRIDSNSNFLHYLWAPAEKGTCTYIEDELREALLDAKETASSMECRKDCFSRLNATAQDPLTVSCSAEHLLQKEEVQQHKDVSGGRAEVQQTCATPPGEQPPVAVNDGPPSFCASCIPAEASSPVYAPPQTRPSPNEHTSPLPSISSQSCSSPPPPDSHEETSLVRKSNSTCRGEERGADVPSSTWHAEDYNKCSCGQPTCGMRGEQVRNPGTTASSNNRSGNKQDIRLNAEAEDSEVVAWQGHKRRDKRHPTREDVQGACTCLHTCNTAAGQTEHTAAEKPNAVTPKRQQLYLPCFLYPRWGPKTPRGICQKDYNRYGIRLVGQHVNLQLLAFILCELLDFRSLHVVVLQRFGLELRALHLPTGICQMFSEQDQIISCLCFSALTRMTSAVIPPLRLISLASAKLSPSRMLRVFPAEPVGMMQLGYALPVPLEHRETKRAGGSPQIQKSQSDAKDGHSTSQEKSVRGDNKQRERINTAREQDGDHVFSMKEKQHSTGKPPVQELARKDATSAYLTAGQCRALLLPQKPGTEERLLLFPATVTEGCRCSLQLVNDEAVRNGSAAATDTPTDPSARREKSTCSSSSTTARWCTRVWQQEQCDLSRKGERRSCRRDGSSGEEGEKKAAAQGEVETLATQVREANHSSPHTRYVRRARNSRLCWREQLSQSHQLSLFRRCYANATTANNSELHLTPRAAGRAAATGTRRPSGAVAAPVAAEARLHPKHTGQQCAQIHRGGSVVGCRPEARLLYPEVLHQNQEKRTSAKEKTQQREDIFQLTENLSFGAHVGNQRLEEFAQAFVAETHGTRMTSETTRNGGGDTLSSLLSFEMLRYQQQLQQEHAQQEQQEKVRRLLPEDVSRMSVWDKVEQLPALNPHDFLPPLHLFGNSCTQEIAALNAVLLQFLDPHPYFALQYSSSASAFDSIINALRQLKRHLTSLRGTA